MFAYMHLCDMCHVIIVSRIVQMMGHVKTVIIFTTSWFVLHENFSNIKWLGCLLTISGIYLFNEYSKYHKCQEEAKKENLFSGHHEELRKLFATK